MAVTWILKPEIGRPPSDLSSQEDIQSMKQPLLQIIVVSILTAQLAIGVEITPEQIQDQRVAAQKGDAHAQYNLGLYYHLGQGVNQDDAIAALWFRKAAEQGDPKAQCTLGVNYHTGLGVPVDHAMAVMWLRKAAEQGYAQAQCALGIFCHSGEGVIKDDAMAVMWFRKAAEQGLAQAQFNLGICYRAGKGAPRDDAMAVTWFRKASAGECPGARRSWGLLPIRRRRAQG